MVDCLYCESWMSVAKTLYWKKICLNVVVEIFWNFSKHIFFQNTDKWCFALFGTIWAILKNWKTSVEESYFEGNLLRLLLSSRLVVNTFHWKKASVTMLSCKFSETSQNIFFSKTQISVALHDLEPFVQFKKCEKHSWRSVTFRKVTGFSLQLYQKYHPSMDVFHVF